MNFTEFYGMTITGHRDIDFVDIDVNTDVELYIDPERIALSNHPFASAANAAIEDFFSVLCEAATSGDRDFLYHLLSYGKEPNETHFGNSAFESCGKGNSPQILMPIVDDMISLGMFHSDLFTQLSDLQLWTHNFHYDRLSDLTTNIIRGVLVEYTYHQYDIHQLELPQENCKSAPVWDIQEHRWRMEIFPHFISRQHPALLVPKAFVGRQMLSSPGELLQKYALKYRQEEHLNERSEFCHQKTYRDGREVLVPPTKKELYHIEVKGQPTKTYLRRIGREHPRMVSDLHSGHTSSSSKKSITISDYELDSLIYGYQDLEN